MEMMRQEKLYRSRTMSRQNRHAYLSYYKKQKCDGYSERVKYFSYDLKVHYELYFF